MKNLIALLTMTLTFTAFAAQDGDVGSTSRGTMGVSINKGDEVRISNLRDVDFGEQTSAPSERSIEVCVYSTTGKYDITASSASGDGDDFRMANNNNTEFIEYDLQWAHNTSANSGQDLDNGETSNQMTQADRNDSDCDDDTNARLFVEVDEDSFNDATAGSYTDTLTLVVSPR